MAHRIQGMIDDYDTNGDGDSLVSALVAYAEDCRAAAAGHQERARLLLAEANRADCAAVAAGREP